MAFIVEDGTGVTGSNSYITAQEYKDYFKDRGFTVATAGSAIQAGLIRATDYIEKRFGLKFKGHRSDPTGQSLSWPRRDVFDEDDFLLIHSNEIPKDLKNATAEYALRAIGLGELAPDPPRPVQAQPYGTTTQSGDITRGPLKKTSVNVGRGAVEQEKEYFSQEEISQSSSRNALTGGLVSGSDIPAYPAADLMLRRLLNTGNRRTTRGN